VNSRPSTLPLERPREDPDELSLQEHRRLVGYLGASLPPCLYLLAACRPTTGLPRWDLLASVSEYYYSGAVALFTGVLLALALELWTYKGYKNVKADRRVGMTGGAAAACVSFFPTFPPLGLSPPWWSAWMGYLHLGSAIVLFGSFIAFAGWLFRKSAVVNRRERPTEKKRRDVIFLVCALVMGGAILWALAAWLFDLPIFWPEAIAIEAFAVSWLVKGEAAQKWATTAHRLIGRPLPPAR
jgi:hypothetical protein